MSSGLRIKLEIDKNNQWFASVWVTLQNRSKQVRFKVDTGCNAVVLSHKTLQKLGLSVASADLEKLKSVTGKQASGEKHIFKELGMVSLYLYKDHTTHVCNTEAICHATRATNDLLGTEVLNQFMDVNFRLSDDKYMELLKT